MIERMEGNTQIKIDVSHHLQKRVDKAIATSRHYPTADLLTDEKTAFVPLLNIPREFLYGQQLREEYEKIKSVLVIAELERDSKYLEKKPILACLVVTNAARLVVIDGHHRERESGRFRDENNRKIYNTLPTRIFTTEEIAQHFNQSGYKLDGKPYTSHSLAQQLLIDSSLVEQEFSTRMPLHKRPTPLFGITTISQLVEKFGDDKKTAA